MAEEEPAAELVRWNAAKQALLEARSIDEIAPIRNRMRAAELYARQARDREMERSALDIRLRAERRMGEVLIEIKAAGELSRGTAGAGDANVGRSTGGSEPAPPVKDEKVTLAQLGITKKLSSRAQELANMPAIEFENALNQEKDRIGREIERAPTRIVHGDDKLHNRNERERELGAKTAAMPQRLFSVIYADPDWQFMVRSPLGLDRGAENHYPTSPLHEIQSLPVGDIAAPDCLLAMWTPAAFLVEAICVAEAWGFASLLRDTETGFLTPAHLVDKLSDDFDAGSPRYITEQIWVKDKLSTGYWFRAKHEVLLFFRKGHPPAPAPGHQDLSVREDDVYVEKQREHSRKPDAFIEMLEQLYPSVAKIELFRRGPPRAGWAAWGNEVITTIEEEA